VFLWLSKLVFPSTLMSWHAFWNKKCVFSVVQFWKSAISSEPVKKSFFKLFWICVINFLGFKWILEFSNHLQSWSHTSPHESRNFTKSRKNIYAYWLFIESIKFVVLFIIHTCTKLVYNLLQQNFTYNFQTYYDDFIHFLPSFYFYVDLLVFGKLWRRLATPNFHQITKYSLHKFMLA
jgi:hypothetical protein